MRRPSHEEAVYFVYIMASKFYGTLYIGITSNLISRVQQHRTGKREWKISVIERENLRWSDLYPSLVGPVGAQIPDGLPGQARQ